MGAIEAVIQKKDPRGERPCSPRMMTSLIVYAYCAGVFSSRKIERATYEDVAFRVIGGGTHPHFTTVNTFRLEHREASWTPRDRKDELESAAKGYTFLRRQAARYGQHLEVVEVVEPGEVHLDSLKVDAMSGWVTVPMGPLQAKLGRSLDAMVDASRTLHGCTSAHVVLHVVPESSVSHAVPGPGAELAVVSHRDWAVLAHEVLHLYGAWDLYHVPGLPSSPQPRQRAEELERMFPGEVMGELRGTPNVGALTAWLVGWSSCARPSYPSFHPSA